MKHNTELIKQIRDAYAKEEGYESFASMASNVNIVPRDVKAIAKRYAEAINKELQAKCERYDELYRLCFSNLSKLRARCQNNERMVSMSDNIRAIIEDVTNAMLAMPQPEPTGNGPYLVQSANEALAGDGEKEVPPEPGKWNDYLRDKNFNQKREDKQ